MRSKTLTETIMGEETSGEYETRFYDKTATAYMFGYACSSGFGGSGFGGGGGFKPLFDFNVPSIVDIFKETPKSSSSFGSAGCSSSYGGAIGSRGSGFVLGNYGNIRRDLGYGLQERYDFSGHNRTKPHLNIDIMGTDLDLGFSHLIDLGFGKKGKW